MSLLNDMLRDLSKHQPVLDGAEGYDEQLLRTSSIAPKKNYVWVGLSFFFVVVFIVVLVLSIAFKKSIIQPSIPEAKNSNVLVQNTSDSSMNMTNAIAAQNIIEPISVQENTRIELRNHINDLFLQADRAIGMDRLTTPVEDNAYAYYQKILSMSANNIDAKEGLDSIAQRYMNKAQEQAQLGNVSQAEALLQRAKFVSARFVDAHMIELGELNHSASIAQTTQESIEPPVTVQSIPSQSNIIKPFVVAEAPSVSVLPNAGWKDEQLARHAQELIQKGKQVEAQELLKIFVANEEKPALSAAVLVELYIQQANTVAADIILEHANYLPVDMKSKLKSQIFSLQGEDEKAITLLEKNLATADSNEGYRSLLASLYHKTTKYPQSILSYQRLISSFGEKPAYWLGLALAYDGLSQPKNALQAYLRLREFPQLQEQVKQYTDQRIAALRSE